MIGGLDLPLARQNVFIDHPGMPEVREQAVSGVGEKRPAYLTTREVADMLRVKERRVYDLAAAGEIPHRRVTGKLLFPSDEIVSWIEGRTAEPVGERPAVLTGSHDPLLDWAVRESGCGLATLVNGSLDGLALFAERRAALSGLHIPEPSGWNVETVGARALTDCVLIAWAVRSRGLLMSEDLRADIASFAQLKGRRVVLRQPGSGGAALFEKLLAQEGLTPGDLVSAAEFARTEADAAAAVATGDADAALGIEAMARQFHLSFLHLVDERFDLLIDRRSYFTEPVQKLLRFVATRRFSDKATAMGGYKVEDIASVRWLSP
jgi:excisionase family DNA binding protein